MSDHEEDEDREAILARRARFVATALAGLSVLPACDPRPQPCLEAPMRATTPGAAARPPPASASAPPPGPSQRPAFAAPCLEVMRPAPPADAGTIDGGATDAGAAHGGAADAGAADAAPRDAGPRDAGAADAGRPMPCLLVARPRTGGAPDDRD